MYHILYPFDSLLIRCFPVLARTHRHKQTPARGVLVANEPNLSPTAASLHRMFVRSGAFSVQSFNLLSQEHTEVREFKLGRRPFAERQGRASAEITEDYQTLPKITCFRFLWVR